MPENSLADVDGGDLEPGTRVEVRNAYDGRWSRGFSIADTTGGRYRLRRHSDDSVLPVDFDPDDVRRERRRQGLWWA